MSYIEEQMLKRGGLSAKVDWRIEFLDACAEVDNLRRKLSQFEAEEKMKQLSAKAYREADFES